MKEDVEVWGSCGDFSFPARAWQLVLTLGHWYGWRPAGTRAPDPAYYDVQPDDLVNWDGGYFPAAGQVMTAEDATALADALERALPDLPDHDTLSDKTILPRHRRDGSRCTSWGLEMRPGVAISPFEEFSGSNKATLRDFIVHCRECAEFWLC